MTQMAHYDLQQAVYSVLSTDAELLSQVTGIYDNPHPVVAYPYLVLGQLRGVDWSTKTTQGMQSVLTLHAYSQISKKEVINILDRVFDLLQSTALDLEGHNLVAMRFDYSEIDLQNDGITYHGLIQFRAYTEVVV